MEDILDRDQRTTYHHRLYHRDEQSATKSKSSSSSSSSSRKIPNTGPRVIAATRRTERDIDDDRVRRHFRCDSCYVRASYDDDDRGIRSRRGTSVSATTWLRLGVLLLTLLVVSVHGAPTMPLEDGRLSSPPKWVNPCGLAAEDIDGDPEVEEIGDAQLLARVVVQAKMALMQAELFRDNYIKETFKIDYTNLHSQFKNMHYEWLPGSEEIPKQLGEKLEQEYLDNLELDAALLNAYEYMQTYAVGLEQIVWDQKDNRLEFRDQFEDTEYKIRSVLCELQVALAERAVTSRPDVGRDVMSSDYRAKTLSQTDRNLRDWLIFRDYMNGLEYIVQVFEHLHRGLES